MWGKNLLRDQLVRVLEPRFRSLNTVRTATELAFNFHSQLLAVPDPLSLLVLYLVSRDCFSQVSLNFRARKAIFYERHVCIKDSNNCVNFEIPEMRLKFGLFCYEVSPTVAPTAKKLTARIQNWIRNFSRYLLP